VSSSRKTGRQGLKTSAVPRPGQCYLCRKRPGTEFYRGLWACKHCLLVTDVKDAIAIVVMLGAIVIFGWVVLTYKPVRTVVHDTVHVPPVHLPALHVPPVHLGSVRLPKLHLPALPFPHPSKSP